MLVTVGVLALPSAGLADPPSHLASAPSSGAAIVTNGEFTNLYLWPDPNKSATEKETWNEHLVKVAETDPAATTETLNKLTSTLVESSYFDLLTQYGVEPPAFKGEEATFQECVNQALTNATENGGVIQWEGESKFVGCEHSHSAVNSPQVDLFVSPDLKVAQFKPFKGVVPDMCSSGEVSAYHTTDLENANFTVIPINTKCNANLVKVGKSLGHEMVETLSDPALFGYINESVSPRTLAGNFQQDYGEGELGDICESIGLHPTPATPFVTSSFGTLELGTYWSNADASCEPRRMMNTTLANIVGTNKLADGSTGLFRMTAKAPHELPIPLVDPPGLGKHFLQALELEVKTGGDNINAGNGLEDGASVALALKNSKTPKLLERVNQGQEWANNSLHAVLLRVPPGIKLEDLTGLTIKTKFNGNDNWDVANVTVKAAVACPTVGSPCTEEAEPPECPLAKEKTGAPPPSNQPRPLVEKKGATLLADGSKGLARLTGEIHSFTTGVSVDPAFASLQVTGLRLAIRTGGDNLRSGSAPGENANAVVNLGNGTSVTFTDINQHQEWSNFSEDTIVLPGSAFPQGMTLDDIKSLTITTNFPGGSEGDNWDILGISLEAEIACRLGVHPLPKPVSATLVEANGSTVLPDGSTGLLRMTGSVHTLALATTPVPAVNAGKVVTGLELVVETGGDDLHGGNAQKDNANATIGLTGGRTVSFEDINALLKWSNNTSNPVALLTLNGLPPGTTLGEITGPLEIITKFAGGTEGDNWDIAKVKLVATGD